MRNACRYRRTAWTASSTRSKARRWRRTRVLRSLVDPSLNAGRDFYRLIVCLDGLFTSSVSIYSDLFRSSIQTVCSNRFVHLDYPHHCSVIKTRLHTICSPLLVHLVFSVFAGLFWSPMLHLSKFPGSFSMVLSEPSPTTSIWTIGILRKSETTFSHKNNKNFIQTVWWQTWIGQIKWICIRKMCSVTAGEYDDRWVWRGVRRPMKFAEVNLMRIASGWNVWMMSCGKVAVKLQENCRKVARKLQESYRWQVVRKLQAAKLCNSPKAVRKESRPT